MIFYSAGDVIVTIHTNRFLSVKTDKMEPESEFAYKWDVPLVIEEDGDRRIHWLKNAGETVEAYTVTMKANAIINPEGNIFARFQFHPGKINK